MVPVFELELNKNFRMSSWNQYTKNNQTIILDIWTWQSCAGDLSSAQTIGFAPLMAINPITYYLKDTKPSNDSDIDGIFSVPAYPMSQAATVIVHFI